MVTPSTSCPFCGAYSVRSCEIEGIDDGCPWDDMLNEPDPDYLREMRDERARVDRMSADAPTPPSTGGE